MRWNSQCKFHRVINEDIFIASLIIIIKNDNYFNWGHYFNKIEKILKLFYSGRKV